MARWRGTSTLGRYPDDVARHGAHFFLHGRARVVSCVGGAADGDGEHLHVRHVSKAWAGPRSRRDAEDFDWMIAASPTGISTDDRAWLLFGATAVLLAGGARAEPADRTTGGRRSLRECGSASASELRGRWRRRVAGRARAAGARRAATDSAPDQDVIESAVPPRAFAPGVGAEVLTAAVPDEPKPAWADEGYPLLPAALAPRGCQRRWPPGRRRRWCRWSGSRRAGDRLRGLPPVYCFAPAGGDHLVDLVRTGAVRMAIAPRRTAKPAESRTGMLSASSASTAPAVAAGPSSPR